MEVPRHRPVVARGGDREVVPLEKVVAAVGLAVAELRQGELVEGP
jgi:hypothetical protein